MPPAPVEKSLLILVDGSSYLYRAFHAMPNLSNSRGEATGAIYGVINMLRSIIASHQPTHIAVVFDAKGPTFRDQLYPEYKANRPPMADLLRQQLQPLNEIITAMGLPLLSVAGVEADDVIGTLAREGEEAGFSVLISTGDKDMAQLVTANITLINTMDQTVLDRDGVAVKFGVPPEKIIDYLALMGDTSDNVPGVPKVGPKTAVKWLQQYGSVAEIIARSGEFKGKVGENLREFAPRLPLSQQLVTIQCDLQLGVEIENLRRGEENRPRLRELYRDYEFKSWLRELLEADGADEIQAVKQEGALTVEYETILSREQLQHWITRLEAGHPFAIDTETTSLNYMEAELVGISFALEPGKGAYLPLAHTGADALSQLNREEALTLLRPLLESETILKMGQNLKYDSHIFANHNVTLRGIGEDTLLLSYLVDSSASRHDLDTLALKYLGRKTITYEEVAGKGKKQIGFQEVPLAQATPYAAEDAEVVVALQRVLKPLLADSGQEGLYRELEMPLLPVLQRIERNGVLIDRSKLQQQSEQLTQQLEEVEAAAYAEVGKPFNLASPKQLQEILYTELGLPVRKKTPKGQPSTAEAVLQDLAQDYRLPELILRHRSLAKLKSTYTDKLPQMISARSGRVHTSYHQAVAATGRLSSSDPNLQNIPIRSAEGRRIRQAFIAPAGSLVVAADYSQIELRIMAHFSEDSSLISAFNAGLDIHQATAAEVFSVALDQVTTEQRRSAKAINFGLIYGMSAYGLANQLQIERGAAQNYIDLYFSRYPGVRAYMDQTRVAARERGYVETLFGRRLYLADINSSNSQRRQYAERTAINAPMQGTAADIIKRAMLTVDAWLQREGEGVKMMMQVHDELVFEVEERRLEAVVREVKRQMETAATLRVPLLVEVGHGLNWDDAH
ncbi:MAG: DNA polymerase I [Gammaproteobacteria bacterium]|nr:DNA polymerase I [Gammaproteobacteria bacterium]